jgi:hypothetical protein
MSDIGDVARRSVAHCAAASSCARSDEDFLHAVVELLLCGPRQSIGAQAAYMLQNGCSSGCPPDSVENRT